MPEIDERKDDGSSPDQLDITQIDFGDDDEYPPTDEDGADFGDDEEFPPEDIIFSETELSDDEFSDDALTDDDDGE